MLYLAFTRKNGNYTFTNDEEVIEGLDPFDAAHRTYCSTKGSVKILQRIMLNTPQSHFEEKSSNHTIDTTHIVSWSRLDNRQELADKLDISSKELGQTSDSLLILRCFRKWGEKCVDNLIGDFSFAIFDEKNATIFCARDHMGGRPIYYYLSDTVFACAGTIPALLTVESRSQKINDKWLVDYLANLSMSFSETAYENIKKIPPGHCLTVGKDTFNLHCYYKPSLQPALLLDNEREYIEVYGKQLQESICCRLASDFTIGAELSGGLDSSGITSIAAKILKDRPTQLHTFGFIATEREPEYIAALLRACSFPPTHLFGWQELNSTHFSAKERALKVLGHPPEHESTTFHTPFYSLGQKLGVRSLLSGFGGDEFVTNVHSNLVIREMFSSGKTAELFRRLQGNPFAKTSRILKMYAKKIMGTDGGKNRYNPSLYTSINERWALNIMAQDCIEHYDLQERAIENATFDSGYNDLKSFLVEKRWHPFIPTRMEQCTAMASSYGIEYRWPLLDVRLINLYLAIPSSQNYYMGTGRYLHRRAVERFIPHMIAWNPGKNMGQWIIEKQKKGHSVAPIEPNHMHARLQDIVDFEKVRRQGEALADHATDGFHKSQYLRNNQRIHLVNQWLQNT